ncbi:MAG: hypothetical protein U9Q33_06715 [Campylobacterota bacterium]|nr:hypothetical protein [Campylobacterota bacterium]
MIKKIYRKYKQITWFNDFKKLHEKSIQDKIDISKLRLILGVGRSGTSWLSKMLAECDENIRYFNEFLPHVKPTVRYSLENDYTAVDYKDVINEKDTIFTSYKYLTTDKFNKDLLDSNFIKRKLAKDCENPDIVLVKEVHSLLMSEGLLKKINTASITITRNSIYVLDSFLSYKEIHNPLWKNETNYIISNEEFQKKYKINNKTINNLIKYRDDGKIRKNAIISKCLTIAIINKMLKQLGNDLPSCMHITYENLTQNPLEYFKKMSLHLDMSFGENAEKELENSQKGIVNTKDPMSIQRDTKKQASREYRNLSPDEVAMLEVFLQECELNL